MQILTVRPKIFAANCYLVSLGEEAVAIDPATPDIFEEAQKRGLVIRYALLTHGHFDHIGGCARLAAAGTKIGCLAKERALALGNDNMGAEFGRIVPPFPIHFTFEDGDVLPLCGMRFAVMATPGHTAGSCCFLTEGEIFTGDTLFRRDIGRCDLPTGSESDMKKSLSRLKKLENLTVYPGHGMPTTLDEEKMYGYLRH